MIFLSHLQKNNRDTQNFKPLIGYSPQLQQNKTAFWNHNADIF